MVARYKPQSESNGANGAEPERPRDAGGRPTSFKEEYIRQASMLCELGATDIELAKFFKVSTSTIYYWKNSFPQFSEALKVAKQQADQRVERSLYQRALGYQHEAEKIFCSEGEVVRAKTIQHYPPDVTACIFWLKNRDPENWRDKVTQEHTGPDGGAIEHSFADELRQKLDKLTVPDSIKMH